MAFFALRDINTSVRRLPFLVVSNVFLVRSRHRRWVMIDSGYRLERSSLLSQLARLGVGPQDLEAVLLTHRHQDHAGNARFFQRHGVPIMCHRADAEVMAGRRATPRLRRLGRDPMSFVAGALARIENREPVALDVDRALEDHDEVFGLELHWAPGHTEGSSYYYHAASRTLFTGDTLLSAHPPLVVRPGLALPYPTFCVDYHRALDSVRAHAARGVNFQTLCSGHGFPIRQGAAEKVRSFLERVEFPNGAGRARARHL